MEDRIQNITKYEENFNRATETLTELDSGLEKWKEVLPLFKELMDYYQSEQWQDDYNASNRGEFRDFPCGILSEDAIYDLYHFRRNLDLKMIRTALESLES